jgi:hypothetical protein
MGLAFLRKLEAMILQSQYERINLIRMTNSRLARLRAWSMHGRCTFNHNPTGWRNAMKTKLIASAIVAVATFGLGATLSATERAGWKFTEIVPQAGNPGAALDAGGMSQTTREMLAGPSLYFVAHVERPDGSADPAYGTNPRGVYLSQTSSGRYVLRHFALPVTGLAVPASN